MALKELERIIKWAVRVRLAGIFRTAWPTRIDQYLYETTTIGWQEKPRRTDVVFTHHDVLTPTGIMSLDSQLSSARETYLARVSGKVVHRSSLFHDVLLPMRFGYPRAPTIGGCYTEPEFRGQRVYPSMLRHIVDEQLSGGSVDRIYVLVSATNTASIRGIESAGFVRIARLRGLRVCGLLLFKRRSV